MSSSRSKNPPKFSSSKDYQTYKYRREFESWIKVTKEDKTNFDEETGYTTLINFMDEEFSKDQVQDTCM